MRRIEVTAAVDGSIRRSKRVARRVQRGLRRRVSALNASSNDVRARGSAEALRALSRPCDVADFQHGPVRAAIREVFAHDAEAHGPAWPTGAEYRKQWEVAMAALTFREQGVLRPDAEVLGVGAGNEPTVFWLTNHVRRVFATDLYLGDEWAESAAPVMLTDPGRFWPGPWEPRRLVVQHMDGRDLRYPDASVDAIFSSSSIEHFGGHDDVAAAVDEMYRVLRPGGVLSLSTELRLEGKGNGLPEILLFTPRQLNELVVRRRPWEGGMSVRRPSDETVASAVSFDDAGRDLTAHIAEHGAIFFDRLRWSAYPHVVLRHGGYVWTSVHLALRKPRA